MGELNSAIQPLRAQGAIVTGASSGLFRYRGRRDPNASNLSGPVLDQVARWRDVGGPTNWDV